ncbi:MAG: tetratricopeptide repeat protein [Flavipsychrobacter sp.]|nr:tetratricopeptide repeat protein [Flavipsychrobacter sp.]
MEDITRLVRRYLLLLLVLLAATPAFSQEPDLSQYTTDSAKLKAWITYCDGLLGNEEGKTEDYPGLITAGKKGMRMARVSNYKLQSLFSFYTAVGFEFSGLDIDSAIYYYRISEKQAIKAGNSKRLLAAHQQLISLGTETEKEAIAQKMLAMQDTTQDKELKEKVLAVLYKYYRDKNQYEKAISYALKSLELKKVNLQKPGNKETDPGNFINIGVTLTQIGDMYYRMGQQDKAMEYFREALEYTDNRYLDGASALYNNMLGIFLDQEKMDSAQVYYRKIYGLKEYGYTSKESFSHANRSYADYYIKQQDLDKALEYGKRAYALSAEDGGDLTLLESNTIMGNIYFARKEYQDALKHLLAVPAEARAYDRESYNILQFLKAECYQALGDWQKASIYYRDYAFTKDTLLSEAGKRNIAEMEAQYQNKDKQQQITLYEAQAKNEARTRILLIVGIASLLLILLLLYINYRNKQRGARILDERNAALQEANKTKATLFSVISHDLRSPISQLYQYLQLQKNHPQLLTEEMKQQHGERISLATASLLETMEDMLVWSKTQMDRFVPLKERVPLHELVHETLGLLGPDIAAKSLKMETRIEPGAVVYADTNLLKIILRNLLMNAIQYSTDGGSITISLEQAESGSTISIKDEGLGMSDEIIALLQSGDHHLSSNRKGLGWSLIKEMAASTGATIDIQRTQPKGTTVNLHLASTAG